MVTRTLQLLLKGRPSAKLGKPRAPVAARGRGPGGWEAEMALPRAAEPTAGPWSPDGGGEEQLMSSRRSAVRGPKTHKPFIGVSGGETRMRPFIYFGFHFSLLFLTCTSRSVTGFLKKQDFLSQWRAPFVFLSPEEERVPSFCNTLDTAPVTLHSRPIRHVPGPPERPGPVQPEGERTGLGLQWLGLTSVPPGPELGKWTGLVWGPDSHPAPVADGPGLP